MTVPVSLGALLAVHEIDSGSLLDAGVVAEREVVAAMLSAVVTPKSAANVANAAGPQFLTRL